MIKRLARPTLLILFGVLLALAMGEGVLRALSVDMIGGTRVPYMDTAYPYTGWAFQPNAEFTWREARESDGIPIKINSKRLRDREHAYQAGRNVDRVLVLGDSYSAALQVPLERAWHQVLGRRLTEGRVTGQEVEIINTGVGGWGTDQQLLFYQNEAYKYDAELVVLQFYGGNDLIDNGTDGRLKAEEKPYFVLSGETLEVRNFPFRGRYQSRVGELRLYQFARFTRDIVLKWFHRGDLACGSDRIPAELQVYARTYSPELAAGWRLTAALIRQLNRDVTARGKTLAVVFFPARRVVLAEDWEQGLQCYPQAVTVAWDLDKPNRLVAELSAREGIPYLDMTPAFRAEAGRSGEPLYLEVDKHFTARGHRFAGELIASWLTIQGLFSHGVPGN